MLVWLIRPISQALHYLLSCKCVRLIIIHCVTIIFSCENLVVPPQSWLSAHLTYDILFYRVIAWIHLHDRFHGISYLWYMCYLYTAWMLWRSDCVVDIDSIFVLTVYEVYLVINKLCYYFSCCAVGIQITYLSGVCEFSNTFI